MAKLMADLKAEALAELSQEFLTELRGRGKGILTFLLGRDFANPRRISGAKKFVTWSSNAAPATPLRHV